MRLCFKIKNNGKLHQNVFLDAAACVRVNMRKYISSQQTIVWYKNYNTKNSAARESYTGL